MGSIKKLKSSDILSGNTFRYTDIFGDANGIAFGSKANVQYYIYDYYCMNPSCKCDDVILSYIENQESVNDEEIEFAIRLSLKDKKYEILDTYGISKTRVDSLAKKSLRDNEHSIELFKKRYKEMKEAGKDILQEEKLKDNNVNETSQEKPKRNDPCPCGSGIKYKKCCGA